MNEHDYEYLVNQLEHLGFGRDTSFQLLNQMCRDQPQFSIQHEVYYGSDKVRALLQFQKSEETGMYFFNNYKLQVLKGNNSEVMKQTFYLNSKEENITLKEAYNLLEGRAVLKEIGNKEGEKRTVWIQLDFKETDGNSNFKLKNYPENYGFDLADILGKHPINELTNEQDRKQLTESLECGNRQSITYVRGDTVTKMFLEAVPQFKSIRIYDSDMKRLKPEQLASAVNESTSIDKNQKRAQQQGSIQEQGCKPKNKSKIKV